MTIIFPELVTDEGNVLIHRVRNFGETLFRHFRDGKRGFIDLEQVDAATTTLVVTRVRSRERRRIVKLLEKMAAAEFPERTPDITAEKAPD